MKTTNSKDLVKVNQILPIMQEHFGQSVNLARIKLMALLLHALCVVQTVSLHKLAGAMPTDANGRGQGLQPQTDSAVLCQVCSRPRHHCPHDFLSAASQDRTRVEHGPYQLEVRGFQHQHTDAGRDIQGNCIPADFQPSP